MDILERIIENLTSDEVRRFKILSNRFKADDEKKVLILFDAIRAGNYKEVEERVIHQLYQATDAKAKNSYYRLRNKLLSNLEKSLLFYHFNYKNTIESYSNIQLAILFKERGLYRESYHYLKKAEKVALAYDQFNVLEIVFDEMVHLAARDVDVDIALIIEKRKANEKKIEILRSSSEVLGVIMQQIRRLNFSRGKQGEQVIEMLEETQRRLEEHKGIFNSASGKISIYKAVSTILLKKGAYKELERYIDETFKEFEQSKVFDRNNHPLKLQMRVWRLNSLRKLLRLKEESEQIDQLWKDLKLHSKQNFNEYAIYYYNSKINNEKLLGQIEEAGHTLEAAYNTKAVIQNDINVLYLLISQADQYFNQQRYEEAFSIFQKLFAHPKFSMLDGEVRFYVGIFELVNSFEAKNYTYTESRYKVFRKRNKSFLKDEYYAMASKFVELVMRLNTAAIEGKNVFLKSAYGHFVKEFPPSEISGNQIILYEVYIRSILEGRPYYEVFCEEVAEKSH